MSHRASSYFLSNTSLTAVDKMWRTRVNSEEKVSACFVVFLCEIQHLLTLFFISSTTRRKQKYRNECRIQLHTKVTNHWENQDQNLQQPLGWVLPVLWGDTTNRKQERQQNKLHSQNPQQSCNQYQKYPSLPAQLPTFLQPQSRGCRKPIQSVDYHQGTIWNWLEYV